MTVIRNITETRYPKGLRPEKKTLDKAIVKRIPYEVSDEELAKEAEDRGILKAIDNLPANNPFKAVWQRLVEKGLLP